MSNPAEKAHNHTKATKPHEKYDHLGIEAHWQSVWYRTGIYEPDLQSVTRPYYNLMMFPYPSAEGLHVGNLFAYTGVDVYGRFMAMQGMDVFEPIGFDAFGMHSENYAIKKNIHPRLLTARNVERFRETQLKRSGNRYDWSHEVNTTDPAYYKWTQWIFLQLFDSGLAVRKKAPVNWCPSCKTVLADEQVVEGLCERCDTPVVQRELEQWFFKITDYAQRLLENLEHLDWSEIVKTAQRNWIGRSEGLLFRLPVEGQSGPGISVFTTRPDTVFGMTYVVLAPEDPLVGQLTSDECRSAVDEYREAARCKSELDRMMGAREKTGVFIGAFAINPVNQKRVPIWTADYVLMTYGTGAIMGVPAHDERDFEFALKFGLPIVPVIDRPDGIVKSRVMQGSVKGGFADALVEAGIPVREQEGILLVTMSKNQTDLFLNLAQAHVKPDSWVEVVGSRWACVFDGELVPFDSVEADHRILTRCKELRPSMQDKHTTMEMLWEIEFYRDVLFHTEHGQMINSGPFTGTPGDVAIQKVNEWMKKQGIGEPTVNYRLRDWLISRQRYWGPPIPIIYCDSCGIVPVPEDQLPVLLPDLEDWKPTGTGSSPLTRVSSFVETACPKCGRAARRETDVSDNFLDSAWYFLRYPSTQFDDRPFDREMTAKWLPVDMYIGGPEHSVLHLLYSRFITMALHDLGYLDFEEPFARFRAHGLITKDGAKMSKSHGNVVNPDEYIDKYGADSLRMYLLFLGPYERAGDFTDAGIGGVRRFLNRVYDLVWKHADHLSSELPSLDVRRQLHETIRKVTEDIQNLKFNTAIAALMAYLNTLQPRERLYSGELEGLLLVLAPFAPHVAEELWERIGGAYSIHQQAWPEVDPELLAYDTVTIAVQVNGRTRATIQLPSDAEQQEALKVARAVEAVRRHVGEATIRRVVYVPGKIINLVT